MCCLLLAMVFAVAGEAQGQYARKKEKLLYILPGASFSTIPMIRVGLVQEGLGGEILLKHELPQIPGSKKSIDGNIRHRAVMGGVTWHPIPSLLFTPSVGYGSAGTYRVIDANGNYRIENEKHGIELGGYLSYIIGEGGHLKGCFFAGVSTLPLFDSEYTYTDVSFGVGMLYLLGY